jgi:hypothetical protein
MKRAELCFRFVGDFAQSAGKPGALQTLRDEFNG